MNAGQLNQDLHHQAPSMRVPEPGKKQAAKTNKGFEEDENESIDDSDSEKPSKRSGRRKIKIEYIEDKNRRHITFSKRKAGIMKKVSVVCIFLFLFHMRVLCMFVRCAYFFPSALSLVFDTQKICCRLRVSSSRTTRTLARTQHTIDPIDAWHGGSHGSSDKKFLCSLFLLLSLRLDGPKKRREQRNWVFL